MSTYRSINAHAAGSASERKLSYCQMQHSIKSITKQQSIGATYDGSVVAVGVDGLGADDRLQQVLWGI